MLPIKRMLGRRGPDSAYQKSQREIALPAVATPVARGLALHLIGVGGAPEDRRRAGQMLLDELSARARLVPVELVVAERPQVHQHDGQRLRSKTYGYYRCRFGGAGTGGSGGVEDARIRIYNRTAVRQQVVAPKVFLNTLLHEWVHHYDFAGLKLPRSPHTSGFYTRLRSLTDALAITAGRP